MFTNLGSWLSIEPELEFVHFCSNIFGAKLVTGDQNLLMQVLAGYGREVRGNT